MKWDGFDASKFGWISDQKGGKPQGFVTDHANSVELQRDNDTDNTYAEIVGSEIGKSIYQKIDTQNSTDAVYTVRFDHAALSSEHADEMQALVNGKPVTMTRIGRQQGRGQDRLDGHGHRHPRDQHGSLPS